MVHEFLRKGHFYPRFWKNAKDKRGWTPLHIATSKNDVNIVAILMKYNSNPTIKDTEGK